MLHNYTPITDWLCASARPSLSDLASVDTLRISAVVTLTENPLFGIPDSLTYLHLPIPDFSVPTMEDALRFVAFVEEIKAKGGKVLVHCYAGCGRTGTMLAIYLVHTGMSAEDAIAHLRSLNDCYIETDEQEEFVRAFEKELGAKKH